MKTIPFFGLVATVALSGCVTQMELLPMQHRTAEGKFEPLYAAQQTIGEKNNWDRSTTIVQIGVKTGHVDGNGNPIYEEFYNSVVTGPTVFGQALAGFGAGAGVAVVQHGLCSGCGRNSWKLYNDVKASAAAGGPALKP
ncbi:hypothetical protein KC727_03390 [Candidatus Kaiserbacteria bacterium]|nr:hypothetical protein [Candidatus Kaiserbacteria bacterium]